MIKLVTISKMHLRYYTHSYCCSFISIMNIEEKTVQNTFICFFLNLRVYFANILFSNISKVPHKIQSAYLRSYTSFLHSVLDSMHILLSYLYEINTSKILHMRYFIKVIKNMFLGFYKQFFAILFFVCETKF